MSRILFFDDDLDRHRVFENLHSGHHEVVHAYGPTEAREELRGPRFDILFLDHDMDLLKTTETGMDVVDYILLHMEASKMPDKIYIHSWNAPAALEMFKRLHDAGLKVYLRPFSATR